MGTPKMSIYSASAAESLGSRLLARRIQDGESNATDRYRKVVLR